MNVAEWAVLTDGPLGCSVHYVDEGVDTGRILATIVFDFWPEYELDFHDPWATLLETLAVGDYIEDPATGRRREKRG